MFSFERELFKCPCIEKKDIEKNYPVLSDESLEYMSLQCGTDLRKTYVFGYLRMNSNGEEYIEIDFYNRLFYFPDNYRRFIIQKNYMMNEIDELEFVNLCHSKNLVIDMENFVYLQESVCSYCPDIYIRTYGLLEVGDYLLRLYFSTHRSGVKEILYKANLEHTASKMNRIDEYNMIGNTPEEIVGLPIKLLRILENAGLEDRVLSKASRNRSKDVYTKYSSYFSKENMPNKYQWLYLEELLNDECMDKTFNKSFYKRLKECKVDTTYDGYKKYMRLSEKLGEYNPYKKIPKPLDIQSANRNLISISGFLNNKEIINEQLKSENDMGYFFEDGRLFTITPVCIEDFIKEAISQDNCLLEHVEDVAKGRSNILFIRKKDKPCMSYLTMEICDNEIVQVKAKYNEDPQKEDWDFIERFASKYEIKFDEYELFENW